MPAIRVEKTKHSNTVLSGRLRRTQATRDDAQGLQLITDAMRREEAEAAEDEAMTDDETTTPQAPRVQQAHQLAPQPQPQPQPSPKEAGLKASRHTNSQQAPEGPEEAL